jgi:hypothetical protein
MNNNTGHSAAARIPCFRNRRTRILIPGLLIALSIVADTQSSMTGAIPAEAGQAKGQTDIRYLEGRWVRPDGGYILDLMRIGGDGKVRAAYFNPRRINVARAELHYRDDGTIRLFIELRDVNYPGSTYNLLYDPKTDSFVGTYFQAVQKATYDVEFVRSK